MAYSGGWTAGIGLGYTVILWGLPWRVGGFLIPSIEGPKLPNLWPPPPLFFNTIGVGLWAGIIPFDQKRGSLKVRHGNVNANRLRGIVLR